MENNNNNNNNYNNIKNYLQTLNLPFDEIISEEILKNKYHELYLQTDLKETKKQINEAYKYLINNIDYINDLILCDFNKVEEVIEETEEIIENDEEIIIEERKNNNNKLKKIIKIISSLFLLIIITISISLVFIVYIPNSKINEAVELIKLQHYEEAEAILSKINKEKAENILSNMDVFIQLNKGNYDYAIHLYKQKGSVEIIYDPNGGVVSNNVFESSIFDNEYYYCYKKDRVFFDYTVINYKVINKDKIQITLKAEYDITRYEIIYILEDDVDNSCNPITYFTKLDDDIVINAPTRKGYEFIGWEVNSEEHLYTNLTIDTKSEHSYVLTPIWNSKTYSILLNANGGTGVTYNEMIISYNETFHLPKLKKTGYNFLGWYYNDQLIDFNTYDIDDDSIFEAKWEPITYTITYTYSLNGEAIIEKQSVKYGDPFELKDISKEGYIFVGWYQGGMLIEEGIYNYTTSMTLVAKFKGESFFVTLDLDGGTIKTDNVIEYERYSYISLPTPTKTNYYFLGWYLGDKKITSNVLDIDSDVTLKAKWAIPENKIIYNLDGGTNNEKNSDSYNITTYDMVILPPTKKGYSFLGWTDQNMIEPIINYTIDKTKKGYIELTAHWVSKSYRITYTYPDGFFTSKIYSYMSKVNVEAYGRREIKGYTYSHWVDEDGNKFEYEYYEFDENITLYAEYTPNTYNLIYELDGGVLEGNYPTTITYDSTYQLPIPRKENCKFLWWEYEGKKIETDPSLKWNFIPSEAEGKDITIKAYFIDEDEYLITYNLLGGSASFLPKTYKKSRFDITIQNPTKHNYDFIGWKVNGSDEIIKDYVIKANTTGDITLTAQYSIKYGKVTFDTDGGTVNYDLSGTYNYGQQIILQTPTKRGYTFIGWKFKGQILTGDLYVNEPTMKLVATYATDKYVLTLNYYEDDSFQTKHQIYYDDEYELPKPIRPGYVFIGWYYKDQMIQDGVWKFETNMTLVAKWEYSNDVAYQVYHYYETTKNENYELVYEKIYYGTAFSKQTGELYPKEGFITPQLQEVSISPDGTTIIEYFYKRMEHKITFIDNNEVMFDIAYKYEEQLALPTISKEGYKFIGWYTDESLLTKFTNQLMPNNDLTLYAKWEKK